MRFLPVNLDAVLVELDDLSQTLSLLASLRVQPIAGVGEIVPAARTLLVNFRPAAIPRAELIERIGGRSLDARVEQAGERIEIPVTYDGEDLEDVARLLGISAQEVIRRHTGSDYTVAFTGFAPGFAYLTGGHPSFDLPRRATPRTRIPAGAVGLAGTFSGVYPQASPGGWQIIGVTATPMWDLSRERPALLQPGQRVRFVDAGARAVAVPAVAPAESTPAFGPTEGAHALEVRQTGLQALFQDPGRHGQAGQGVSASGAMDRASLRAANRLVGNPADAACIEAVYGGFQLVCRGEAVVAVTGAEAPLDLIAVNGARWPVPRHAPVAMTHGDTLVFGEPRAGIRSYIAVRGGFAVAPVLGSCATDTLANIGPRPIVAGDVLPIRPAPVGAVVGEPELPRNDLPTLGAVVTLDVVMGPRTDWFTPEAVERFARQTWTVTPQSNRVGVRLAGDEPLVRTEAMARAELPSEGTALGALQVPPNGQPVLFMADHPLTGGYPVIATVATYHLDRAGQLPVGARIRFRPIAAFEAVPR
ncbi:5-oxoprolinase/urea amidolyase family protein [Variovorax ureilyticus]|uniref:5-oxoprolinase subunit B/C family protein n=1 Tax=Variovorax ureilyticus TaxID=1836198 RepID=UPI003D669ECE